MVGRLHLFVLLLFLGTIAIAQTPVPDTRYTLHAQKEPRGFSLIPTIAPPSTVIAMTPENGLLVLIPQPNDQWVLKRLTDWDTKAPHEQTLAITGESTQENDVWIVADLTVNPDGNYLIVRINYRHGAIDSNRRNRRAGVILVDLRTFSIVSRRITTDPLLADSEFHFNKGSLLITKGLAKRLQVKSPALLTLTDTYEAAALNLPEMHPSNACHYNDVSELRDGGSGWTKPISKDVSDGCTALLAIAGVSMVQDLPGSDHIPDRVAKPLNPSCIVVDVSKGEKFALYSCVTSHFTAWDTVKTTSRSRGVLSVADRKTVVSIPLPFNQPITATLAAAGGHDYLLLLRDGIKLETFRLP